MELIAPSASPAAGTVRTEKIHALTGLRFLAAAMIVIHHSRGVLAIPKSFLAGVSLEHGVSFFFVLSGFILAHVYRELPDHRAVARFFCARFARVWPAHMFAFCAAFALGVHEAVAGGAHPGITIANAAMIHAWVPATAWFFSVNAVSWSISTEFFFYLAFPLLLAGFGRTWWWKLAIAAALVAGAVIICERLAIPSYADAAPHAVNRAGLLYISPVTRLFEFVLGMLTARVWITRAPVRTFSRAAATLAEIACVILCAAGVVFFSSRAALTAVLGPNWTSYLGHAGAAPVFALLILVFASQRGLLSRLFAHPVAVLLGEISFSVYLLHQIMIRWLVSHRSDWAHLGETTVYIAFWAALLLASWAVWRLVETPARRALMRFAPAQ